DFEREALLDPAIQFPNAVSEFALDPRAVLLTGATGLVGTYLLQELLGKTRARIHCLVRADDQATAKQRIVRQLQSAGLWREEYEPRIMALAGDIACARLGLDEARFRELGGEIDTIYHCAGVINMRYSYERLRPANVEGVKEILRLAGLIKTKPLHFVSSIAVFYSDAHPSDRLLTERDTPRFHPSLKGSYGKSKWVADRLVARAQERGLPACIYRPTRIMGHSKTGALNESTEILPALLKGCILLGLYPDWDIEVTLVPVDYVSRAMVHLAGQSESFGKAFHFFNPEPVHWRKLMAIVRDLGYPLEVISYAEWRREINLRAGRFSGGSSADKKFFAALVLAFMGLHYLFRKRPPFDGRNTLEGLAGSGISCAPIDRSLIEVYVNYWRHSGFLPHSRVG
ncbi:MAG: thioester reductase domain-containing protein, partial [Methylococcales bacterium]